MPHVVITLRMLVTCSRTDRARTGERVQAVARERRADHREIAARDQDRALAEVEVDDLVGVAVEHAEAPHQPRERAVAIAGAALRLEHLLVDGELAAGEAAERLADPLEPVFGIDALDERRW